MDNKLFEVNGIEIWKRGERFFIRYDAGSHQPVLREDEITAEDAQHAQGGLKAAMKVLFALQKRLIQAGTNPYQSNID